MKTLVVNCSAPHYNLAVHKLSDWLTCQGDVVDVSEGNPGMFALGYAQVWLSVIFSWDAPRARDIALRVKGGSEVWAGGPGLFALQHWWRQQTSLALVRGLDPRFDKQRGHYRMTFASRGCPINCSFCIVPRMEGTAFTFDPDFIPAPVLCDNNLSALPDDFQDYIIERYKAFSVILQDANSGFEPRTFTEDTYNRWKPVLNGPWRFALDELSELSYVERMMGLLNDVSPRRKRVYVLIGNEPFEACLERAMKVIEWGGEPFCQPYRPLNALDRRTFKIAYDWTPQRLGDFARYFNRFLWRSVSLDEYTPRRDGVAVFGGRS